MSNPAAGGLADDAALVRRAQAGDLAAFDALVLRHQQEVFAIAVRMLGDRDEAQDVAQDTFVRAYRGLRAFRSEATLSTWLVSITMNLCRNRRRWWARRRRVIAASLDEPVGAEQDPAGHDAVDPAPAPSEMAQSREQRQAIGAALLLLEEAARQVVVLRDLQGCSYEEIAAALHCEIGTVKSRLHRARLTLRALLDGQLT